MLRDLIARALSTRGFTVARAGNAAEATKIFADSDPDGIVMDVELGPGPDGFSLAEALLERQSGVAIVFLTNLPDPRFAGRKSSELPPNVAYLNKRTLTDADALAETLDATLRGAVEMSMRHDQDPDRQLAGLTQSQIDVLRLVALGKTNQQIAEARRTTLKAVEGTLARAFAAIGLADDGDANLRVLASRRFLQHAGQPIPLPPDGEQAP